jgi:anionic cell wall polymer biosynthesis LytR-Cps2A-Psr (LCP) family protein
MNRKRLIIIGLDILALLVLGVVTVYAIYTRPLGPSMQLDVPAEVQAQHQAAAQPAQQSDRVCGSRGILNLFIIGRASPNEAGVWGADAIRLAVVDFDSPAAGILALPGELWVNTPVLADLGYEQQSLEMVYQLIWEDNANNPDHVRVQKATQALAQTILDNFEFVPDRYATVEEDPFIDFIDDLGGVEVTLPEAVDGTYEGYGIYPAGLQTLDGLRTLNLTRLIHPDGQLEPDIWGSLERQNYVLQGMRDTILTPDNILLIPELVKSIRLAITTDLSVNQVVDLGCMVQEVGSDVNLQIVTSDLVTIDPAGHMLPDIDLINALIDSLVP